MYNTSILMLLTWPVLIIAILVAVRISLYFYEKARKKAEKLIEE